MGGKNFLMKYKQSFAVFLLMGILLIAATSCSKKDYLSGGSLHEAVTPLNNMDYLKGNAYKLFDTATLIIERLNLTAEVNSAQTFFAFTDYSVANFISVKLAQRQQTNPLATYNLDSLIRDINADSVRQYLINETVNLENAPELRAKPLASKSGITMGVLKQLQTDPAYLTRTRAATYLLYFVKVRGALDEPGVTPPTNENDISVLCQTSGIKTSSGATTLHVLNNNHTFVRF
jgi:hypothetical protein